MKGLAILLTATLVLAGCITDNPTDEATPSGQDGTTQAVQAFGVLVVTVVGISLKPLAGANVSVGYNHTATSGNDGKAEFEGLPANQYLVTVTLEGYRTGKSGAVIGDGEFVDLVVKLQASSTTPEPETIRPEENGTRPNEEFHLRGYFDCSATYLIITGDCALIVDNVTSGAGLGMSAGNLTDEDFTLDFPVDFGWKSIVGEMHWKANGPVNGDQMTFALEPTEYNSTGHAPKYAREEGTSPLRWIVHAGEPHPTATASADGDEPDMPNAQGGEVLRTRSYVAGQLLHRPAGTSFLGIGVAIQQQFEVIVTVFYEDRAPEDYSVEGSV